MGNHKTIAAVLAAVIACLPFSASALATSEAIHRVEVRQGEGYTSHEVGINTWETSQEAKVTFLPRSGYTLRQLMLKYRADGEQNYVSKVRDISQQPVYLEAGSHVYWLEYTENGCVILTIPENCEDDLILSAVSSSAEYHIAVSGDAGIITEGGGDAAAGELVTVTAVPKGQTEIKRIQVMDTATGEAKTADIDAGVVLLGDSEYPFTVSSGGAVSMKFKANADISIYFFSDRLEQNGNVPQLYIPDTKGVAIKRNVVLVSKGGNYNVSVTAELGYVIDEIAVELPYKTVRASTKESSLYIDGVPQQIEVDGDTVTLRLKNIETDMTIRFHAIYDMEHIPVTVTESTGLSIDKDCGKTVSQGDDVSFKIKPTSSNYKLTRITLAVGDDSRTVDTNVGAIRLNGKVYDMPMDDDGNVKLHVTDIQAPIRVSAAAKRVSQDNDILAGTTQNCTIESDRSHVADGGAATFTVTPDRGYDLKNLTLQVGTQKATADIYNNRSIKVGTKEYKMSISSSGVLTLKVSPIYNDVRLSATAVRRYAEPPIQPPITPSLHLNRDFSGPFFVGYTDNRFCPEGSLTRAEAVVMLARLTNYDRYTVYPSGYVSDVMDGAWFANEVYAFYHSGILEGNRFQPNTPVTRGDFATWLYRLDGRYAVTQGRVFPDIPASGELHDAVSYGVSCGWIHGFEDGLFRPANRITRAEAAKLMNRAMNRRVITNATGLSLFKDVTPSHWAYWEILTAANF